MDNIETDFITILDETIEISDELDKLIITFSKNTFPKHIRASLSEITQPCSGFEIALQYYAVIGPTIDELKSDELIQFFLQWDACKGQPVEKAVKKIRDESWI